MTIAILAAVAVSISMVASLAWLIGQATFQQARIQAKLDTLKQALVDSRSAATHRGAPDSLVGEIAPDFALAELNGERVASDTLLASAKPLLLVFAEPRCGPCYEILPDLGGWHRVYGDRLAIALVSTGAPHLSAAMTAEYGIWPVLMQQEYELSERLGLTQYPAAILIQPDGRISAGPRYGTRAIRRLVADSLGLVLPPEPRAETRPLGVGDPVPTFHRPDLRGNAVDLSGGGGAPSLVLFWSPGCSHCQALVPAILAVERHPRHPAMTIVSKGPAGLTEAAGFMSPVMFDDDRTLARTFGVEATPSVVIIDGQGQVAAKVIRGGPGVRTLLERIAPAPVWAAEIDSATAHMEGQHRPSLIGMM